MAFACWPKYPGTVPTHLQLLVEAQLYVICFLEEFVGRAPLTLRRVKLKCRMNLVHPLQ